MSNSKRSIAKEHIDSLVLINHQISEQQINNVSKDFIEEVYSFIFQSGDTTCSELEQRFGKSDYVFFQNELFKERNLINWIGFNFETIHALQKLGKDKRIKTIKSDALTHSYSGNVLLLPVANTVNYYRTYHCFPIAFIAI